MRAANLGHAKAQFRVGEMYLYGRGVVRDPALAAKWFQKAADQKHCSAMLALAALFEKGDGVPVDLISACKLYKSCVEEHFDDRACFRLAQLYEQGGPGISVDLEAAKDYYRRCGRHHAESRFRLGLLALKAYSPSRAVPDLEEAARWGHLGAQSQLGRALNSPEYGISREEDSFNWLLIAAARGDNDALFEFLKRANKKFPLYSTAISAVDIQSLSQGGPEAQMAIANSLMQLSENPKVHSRFRSWALKAELRGMWRKHLNLHQWFSEQAAKRFLTLARTGHAVAQFGLAQMLLSGRGMKRPSPAAAVLWLRKAAESGHCEAQSLLCDLLIRGKGVPHDTAQAIYWLRKSAEGGLASAYYKLAKLLHDRGSEGELVEAAQWCRAAADRGNPDAALLLSSMYQKGLGLTQDILEALKWAQIAAAKPRSPEPRECEAVSGEAPKSSPVPTKPDYTSLLRYLDDTLPRTARELAEELGIDKREVNRRLYRLRDDGLIENLSGNGWTLIERAETDSD